MSLPFYEDFRAYYEKATILEMRNHYNVPAPNGCGDPLMDTVTIYDTIHRRYAGFSNVLEDLHRRENFECSHDLAASLWLYGLHRMTGSGASFFPKTAGEHRHGYHNSVVKEVAACVYVEYMIAQLQTLERAGRKMFTSIGNQPPPFPKPKEGYRLAGVSYFCEVWPEIVLQMCDYLTEPGWGQPVGIQEATEKLLALNRAAGCKQFRFTMTAIAMDLAEYWPAMVAQDSPCDFGSNAELALDAMFDEVPRRHSRAWRQARFGELCAELGAFPYDVEDVLCDVVRYWLNYVPRKGYEAFSEAELKNNSSVQVADFQRYIAERG